MAEKVADIRKDLVELGLTPDEAQAIKGRAALIEKRDELKEATQIDIEEIEEEISYDTVEPETEYDTEYDTVYDTSYFEDNFEDGEPDEYDVSYPELNAVEPEEDLLTGTMDKLQSVSVDKAERGTPEWEDYVMSQFMAEELIDFGKLKTPNLKGVSRVANKMFKIEKSGPVKVETWFANNHPAATVIYEVIARNNETRYTFSAVADAWIENMGGKDAKDFTVHPAAIAESRAEARALKKLLDLRSVPAYEEVSKTNGGYGPSVFDEQNSEPENITSRQQTIIEQKCKQFGIDVYKFINKPHFTDPEKHPEPKYSIIEEISHKDAVAMCKELQKYQELTEDSKEIPKEILE